MGTEASLVKARFGRGCRCFSVMIDGSIAGYGWLSTGPEWIGELQMEITPLKGQAYIWNCVTLAEHRRRGVFKALIAGIAEAARGLGITRLWIGTLAIPGESAVPQARFRPAAHFQSLRLLGLFALRGSVVDPEVRKVLRYREGVFMGTVKRRTH